MTIIQHKTPTQTENSATKTQAENSATKTNPPQLISTPLSPSTGGSLLSFFALFCAFGVTPLHAKQPTHPAQTQMEFFVGKWRCKPRAKPNKNNISVSYNVERFDWAKHWTLLLGFYKQHTHICTQKHPHKNNPTACYIIRLQIKSRKQKTTQRGAALVFFEPSQKQLVRLLISDTGHQSLSTSTGWKNNKFIWESSLPNQKVDKLKQIIDKKTKRNFTLTNQLAPNPPTTFLCKK